MLLTYSWYVTHLWMIIKGETFIGGSHCKNFLITKANVSFGNVIGLCFSA